VSVLEWIAQKIKDKENVIGLQLLNEPHPDDLKKYNAWCEYFPERSPQTNPTDR
jgi:aryl-phospho-beta-D-glucosidase BglC (GH1 family)